MTMTADQLRAAAEALVEAEQTGQWTEPVSNKHEDATVADAYRIGLGVRDLKLAAGRTVKGHKIGFTSKAMRSLVGATEPDYGFLFDDWFVPEGSVVPRGRMNRPLVEQEIAFVMGATLRGPSVNAADVIRATDFVLPAWRSSTAATPGAARRCSSTASPTRRRAGSSCSAATPPG